MAVSPIQICNQAISWLGGNLITSLDDPSIEAQLCKANYEPLRDVVLEDREWTFAMHRAEPSRLTERPLYGFDYFYAIPSDAIRVVQVSAAGNEANDGIFVEGSFRSAVRGGTGIGRETRIEWLVEGDTIVVQINKRIYLRYIRRITDTTKFSPSFDQCLAARIAADIAIPITNSLNVQRDMSALYDAKLRNAFAVDGMQGRSYNVRADSLTIVR
jgi:hypothetical protein